MTRAQGFESLDNYLPMYAGQDMRRKANSVFVLVDKREPVGILGYYTLCATSLAQGEVPRDGPQAPAAISACGRYAARSIGRRRRPSGAGPGRAADRRRDATHLCERRCRRLVDARCRCHQRQSCGFLPRAWVRQPPRFVAARAADERRRQVGRVLNPRSAVAPGSRLIRVWRVVDNRDRLRPGRRT